MKKLFLLMVSLLFSIPATALAADDVRILTDFPLPEGIHAGIFLAEAKGWYRDAGLNVEILDGKGSNVTIQQAASDQVDVGLAQLSAMASAVSSGIPVTSIMGIAPKGDIAVAYAQDTGIKTLADLKGHKIAAPLGSAAVALFKGFLVAGGLKSDDIELVYIDGASELAAYNSRSIDGVLVTVSYWEPVVKETRPASAFLYADYGLSVPSYGLVTSTNTLKKRPDVLKRVVAATQRAWTYILAGHEQEGVDAIMKARATTHPDAKILMGMLKLNETQMSTEASKGMPFGYQSDKDWQEALTVMEKAGLVKAGWKVQDFFTNSLIATP